MVLLTNQSRGILSVRVADIAIIVFLISSITFDDGSIPVQIARAILVFIAALEAISKRPSGGVIIIWQLLFVTYVGLSVGWAVSESSARAMAVTVLINGICVAAVAFLLHGDAARTRLSLLCFMIAPAFLMTRVSAEHGILVFFDTRSTDTTSANIVGMAAAFGFCLAFVGLTQRIITKRWIALTFLGVNLAVTLLSASRKAILVVGIVLVIYSFIKVRKQSGKGLISVFLTAGLTYAGYWLIMNVSSLYNLVGNRIETMLNGISGDGEVDDSTATRLNLVEYGLEWFRDQPWLGYGGDNFRTMMAIDHPREAAYYAHNNFIEVIVNYGIFGIVLFYWVYVLIIVTGLRKLSKLLPIQAIVLSMMVGLLISEYGFVDYFSRIFMSFVAVAWVVVCTDTVKNERMLGSLLKK